MSRYRRKPTMVEAVKWSGEWDDPAVIDLLDRSRSQWSSGIDPEGCGSVKSRLTVQTIDGNFARVPTGAYVVVDSQGFAYPCDARLFEENHEPIELDEARQLIETWGR